MHWKWLLCLLGPVTCSRRQEGGREENFCSICLGMGGGSCANKVPQIKVPFCEGGEEGLKAKLQPPPPSPPAIHKQFIFFYKIILRTSDVITVSVCWYSLRVWWKEPSGSCKPHCTLPRNLFDMFPSWCRT